MKCSNNSEKGRKGETKGQTENNKMVDLNLNISIILNGLNTPVKR